MLVFVFHCQARRRRALGQPLGHIVPGVLNVYNAGGYATTQARVFSRRAGGERAHAAHESVLVDRLADRVALVGRLMESLNPPM